MTNRAQEFADRLVDLESSGDVAAFVSAVFASDVELVRPETGRAHSGHEGARTFWAEYLAQFEHVHSTFNRIHDGEIGVLEWVSTATLPNGTEISYAGVSLLDFDGQDQVRRFSTYYDTSAFQPPTS